MSAARLEYLLNRYLDKNCTHEEHEELFRLMESASFDAVAKDRMDEVWTELAVGRQLALEKLEAIFDNVLKAASRKEALVNEALMQEVAAKQVSVREPSVARTAVVSATPVRRLYRLVAAAVIAMVMATGIYLFSKEQLRKPAPTTIAIEKKSDIPPGGNKAVLTLADGSRIILDSVMEGNLSVPGNVRIVKLNDGMLAYNTGSDQKAGGVSGFNTVSTPRGGQYQIILPDGSTVWLNSMSSLRFPVSFPKGSREVELKGEAYFKIVEDRDRPFQVKVNDRSVQVLGTEFNVMAYSDEKEVETTLVSGAVKVTSSGTAVLLKPGEQARWRPSGSRVQVAERVNMEEVLAWKNGLFQFNNASIQSIMRQAQRWYDIEVEYRGSSEELFNGSLPRSVSATTLFKVFEAAGPVKFQIQGKKVIVNLL